MPQASDSDKLDGLNTHMGIFDEIHEFKDYKLISVIKNSRAARLQPLLILHYDSRVPTRWTTC
ncbi:terminase large subunit [Staphylococcus aureus]|nr:terminase large subunit [Staphylococcus aureus]